MRDLSFAALVFLSVAGLNNPSLAQPQGVSPSTVSTIAFRDFFRMPVGPLGLEFTELLRLANNTKVQIAGYMVAQEDSPKGLFLLTPRPVRMSEHADGDADDLPVNTLAVLMPTIDQDQLIEHHTGLMKLTGVLKVGRFELDNGRVVWVRLLLDPPENAKR